MFNVHCKIDTLFLYPNIIIQGSIFIILLEQCVCVCINATNSVCVLCINAHLVYKIHQTKIRLDVDCSYSRVHYLEINDPYRTWQESFKVDELENSAC